MGLFKKIGRAIKKGVKDVGKFAKKAAPIALALTGVGGVVGGVAGTALKAASKLKSTGTNVQRAAFQSIKPLSVASAVRKALPPSTATARRAPPVARKTTVKRKPAPKPKKPSKAVLNALYATWKATDQSIPWEDYANMQLGQ